MRQTSAPFSSRRSPGGRGPAAFLAFVGIAVSGLGAQTSHNEVIRFGARDLVQSASHAGTGFPLEVPGVQPAGYMVPGGKGVPAGTQTWIWYPSPLNRRLEDRMVTGHMIAVRPSASTPLSDYSLTHPGQGSPGVPIYLPKFAIYEGKARPPQTPTLPFGDGFDPDFSKPPILTYNTVHRPLVQPAQADQALLWTVTYNTSLRVSTPEIVLSFEWEGGEHSALPRSQSLPTGWSESKFEPAHWGWASPAPGRTITHFDSTKILPGTPIDVYSSPMGGYFEGQATVAMHSSWGEERNPLLSSFVYPSYNVGSGIADVASTPGTVGWDVFADSRFQGKRALPLFNVGLVPKTFGTPLLGRTLEVDPADPLLTGLWGHSLADGLLDQFGLFLPNQRIPVPALGPAAVGLWVGMEYGIVDLATGAVPESSQATWFYIQR